MAGIPGFGIRNSVRRYMQMRPANATTTITVLLVGTLGNGRSWVTVFLGCPNSKPAFWLIRLFRVVRWTGQHRSIACKREVDARRTRRLLALFSFGTTRSHATGSIHCGRSLVHLVDVGADLENAHPVGGLVRAVALNS